MPLPPDNSKRNFPVLGGLAAIFILLACVFAWLPQGSGIPLAKPVGVSAADISTAPRFSLMKDDAKTEIEGFQRNCMDCHDMIDSSPARSTDLMQHEDIHLDHGANSRCVNCHAEKNRDKLTLRDGSLVGFSQSTQLCAQCHGTTYRRWQRGAHGKTMGYWDVKKGVQKRLQCANCHDPHSPHYNPMKPLPAPNTLRMGTPHRVKALPHEEHRSPLSQYRPEYQEQEKSTGFPQKHHDSPHGNE